MKNIFYVLLFCAEYTIGSALSTNQQAITEEQRVLNGAVFLAVDSGNVEQIKEAVESGACIDCYLKDATQESVITLYTKRLFDVDVMLCLTALHYASSVCLDESVVTELLRLGVNPFSRSNRLPESIPLSGSLPYVPTYRTYTSRDFVKKALSGSCSNPDRIKLINIHNILFSQENQFRIKLLRKYTRLELLKRGINKQIDSPIFDLIGDFLYEMRDETIKRPLWLLS